MTELTTVALSAIELSELASCESVIEHGLKIFHAVGVALLTIREKRLYRAEFKTFEEYCQARWGFTDERARLLMRGAEAVDNIAATPTIVGVLPANEAQVRPLITLSPDQQREAWQTVVETAPNGKITGALVEQVAQQFKPINSRPAGVRPASEGVEPDLDENGLPLVDHINAVTNERLAEQVNLDEDEGIIGVGDTVQYLGQTYKVRASGSKVWLDVPSRHPLRSEGLDPDDIILIERAAHASTKAPQLPASVPAPSEAAQRTAEIPVVDGLPINESHPVGFEGLYATPEATGYGKATCTTCGETHNGWTPIRAGQWKCRCGETTNDDQMQIVGKAEYDLEQRLKRNGKSNGHKPADPPADEDWTNDEWYTPADIIQRVRAFMGEIDVDPATCDYAQRAVQAKTYYTRQTDGLIHEWHGRVWLNPPYSYPLVERFTGELLRQYRQGIVKEAIVLVNNRTDAAWFQSLLVTAEATQFVSGRINFERKGLQTSANRQGQVFFYLGSRAVEYSMAFGDMGAVMRCMWGQKKA